ncbi:MAG: molybdopterin molybdotransferase MoeA [Pseudomonadales bacterium]
MSLTPVHEALELLLADVQSPVKIVPCKLNQALHKVLAENISSTINVPPSDNSAMDGYAVRSNDLLADTNKALPISQRIQAGHRAEPLTVGTAARIFTGATIPAGADAVVMQENCVAADNHVTVKEPVTAGENIRRRGQDIAAGSQVLRTGTRLRAQELGLLASLGIAKVQIFEPLRVAVLSTGDELAEPGSVTGPEQIYNSNRYTLRGLLAGLSCEVIDAGIVADDPRSTRATLNAAAARADCVISSGGVSVGEADYIKAAIEDLGELRIWKLAMKPGKPLAYGRIANTPFFGLPGNPAAVFATFCIVVRPYLLRLQGVTTDVQPLQFKVKANFDWSRAGLRQEYLRGRIAYSAERDARVDIFSNQSSGVLSSACWANCFVVLAPGQTVLQDEYVTVIPFDAVLG